MQIYLGSRAFAAMSTVIRQGLFDKSVMEQWDGARWIWHLVFSLAQQALKMCVRSRNTDRSYLSLLLRLPITYVFLYICVTLSLLFCL